MSSLPETFIPSFQKSPLSCHSACMFTHKHVPAELFGSLSSAYSFRRAFAADNQNVWIIEPLAPYHDCDPLTMLLVKAKDQLLPQLVMDFLGDYPGWPGLFAVGALLAAHITPFYRIELGVCGSCPTTRLIRSRTDR